MNAVAPLAKVKAVLGKAFPGIRFTSETRTRAEQDALIRAGKTKARNSQHVNGTGIDMVLPKGATPAAVRAVLSDNGIEPGEFIDESGKGSNQGTGKHLHVGLAPKGGDPASTYDRVTAAQQDTGPSISKVYEAYKTGKMDPTDAAQFEHDVLNGSVMLPRGAALRKKPPVYQLPDTVVKAYNGREMSDEDRAQIDADLKAGVVALPRGAKLKAPAPRSTMESLGIGVRNVMTGTGALLDLPAAAVNALVNNTPGGGSPDLSATPFRDLANAGADAIGLEKPETSGERLVSAIAEGGTQGLLTAGLAAPFAGTSTVAKTLAANPILDTVSGATSGLSSEVAQQAGAGPVGQLVAGLAGGGVTAIAPTAIKARLGRNAGKDITEITTAPKEALIEPDGTLTPDGREVAAQNGITPDELKQAFGEAPPDVQRRVANDSAESMPLARAANDDTAVAPVEPDRQAAPAARTPEPETVATPPEAAPTAPDTPLPATAKARVDEATAEQIPLTRGQATQEFAVQDAEQTLLASQTKEGEAARAFRVEQADAIKQAAQRFQEALGDTSLNATDRGQVVQKAIRELRDAGAAGVSALYKQAEELAGEGLALLTDDIKKTATDILIDEGIPESVKREIGRQLARYGIVGKAEKMNELGITKVTLDDGSTVQFRGEVEPLTVANAENLRQAVNKQYLADPTHNSQALKPVIDDAVEEAIQAAIDNPKLQAAGIADAYKTARAAHKEQKQTFSAKDVVQQIVDYKKGTGTDVLKAENVIKTIMDTGPEALTNLRKIKAILLSKPTEQSKAAWQAIKLHGVADIFGKAVVENANLGGGSISAVSGAKLSTAIEKFGVEKLKVLLDQSEFNQLMKLRRIIRNATVPISGTTNPAGTSYKLMKFLGPMVARLSGLPGVGPAVEIVSNLSKQAKEASQATATLKGVAEYTAEEAAKDAAKSPDLRAGLVSEADQKARAFLKSFIDIAGSERLIAPIIAAGSQEGADE
jgi:hypothetical protein